MSTGAKQENQSRTDQSGGGQVVGKAPSGRLHQPPAFLGQGGKPDNQSTSRPKGAN